MRALMTATCAVALAVLVAAAPARADEWNKKTFLTFSGPVQVPGVTLPAGTYTFQLADLSGNRHVVQIFDKDMKKVYTTILAVPDQRLEPTDKPVVLFSEQPAGTPPAIKAWFYPGDTIGDEFVYPKRQAVEIARATHQTVLASNDESRESEHMKTMEIGRVNESGEMTTTSRNNSVGTSGSAAAKTGPEAPAATTTASARTNTAPANTARATTARRELPRTASSLPLFALFSAISLAAGLALGRARRIV
jgi:hypothetical protein